jgi:transcription initiation factor TFIIIB Brf1 subunit/transcription initiation factor TFIIB
VIEPYDVEVERELMMPDGPCDHTKELRWEPLRGEFECLACGMFIEIPELAMSVPWPARADAVTQM